MTKEPSDSISMPWTENAHPNALLRYHALVMAYATDRQTQPAKTATSRRLNLKLMGSLASCFRQNW